MAAPRRIRTQDYNGNTYITTNLGVLKIQNPTAQIVQSGLPRGLDLAVQAGGGGSWLADQYSVSYRLVWGIKDLNNNYIYGPPSQRIVYTNATGAPISTQLQFFIPVGITTAHFFQIYRSRQQPASIGDPGDELFLCYERNPTIAEITTKKVLFANTTDLTDDALLGAALYTNATQEGAENENTQPPYCRDVCLYKDHVVYAYTKLKQSLQINMVGVDAGMNTQTITINSVTYTASTAAENIATATFFATTAGTVATNIDATARSLVRVINQYTGNSSIYAYYISGFNDVPGKIYLESRQFGDPAWFVIGSSGMLKYWAPQLALTQIDKFTSDDSDDPHSLIISKFQQPEHVPYIDYFPVGAKNETIQRVVALRDSVIIFKDYSVWRMVGTDLTNFQISLLDNTVSIVSRDSVYVLNNMAFALTNQGVVAVSDNGVQILSRQIEFDLIADVRQLQKLGVNHDNVVSVAHESERNYVLCLQTLPDNPLYETALRLCYVYNYLTNSWTRWYLNANCFTIFGDRIYYGLNNNVGAVLKQRNGYADFVSGTYPAEMEFCDPEGTLAISAISPSTNSVTATFTDATTYSYPLYASPDKGWIIFDQATGNKYYLISVVGTTYTFNTVSGLVVGNYKLYRNIKMDVLYNLRSEGDSFEFKQFDEVQFDLGTMFAYSFDVGFANELDKLDQPISSYFNASQTAFNNPITENLNDFTLSAFATPSYHYNNIVRTYIGDFVNNDGKQYSRQLYVQVKNQTAGSRLEIKGMGLSKRSTGSHRA